MITFDAPALLADLDSPEAEVLAGSVVVTASAHELLADLREAFISWN